MAGEENPTEETFPPLADDCEVYRALIAPKWFRQGQITKYAFMRRGPHPDTGQKRDVAGLSVALCGDRDKQETIQAEAAQFPKSCVAVCSLTPGGVRSVSAEPSLDVKQDRVEHANITGLPEMPADDDVSSAAQSARDEAEFLGGRLAGLAVPEWIKAA